MTNQADALLGALTHAMQNVRECTGECVSGMGRVQP